MNLYLIGYRGAGKTGVGRLLAERLSFTFLDMDDELSHRLGRTISEVVAAEGWEYFRRAEKHLLAGITKTAEQVVATGGGIVLDSDNIWRMKQTGKLIWLKVDAGTAARRLDSDPRTTATRPSLTNRPLSEEIAQSLSGRVPLYTQAADIVVDTGERSMDAVCDAIVARLKKFAEMPG